MSENSSSTRFVRWTARVVAALGLGFVFVPLIWRWLGNLPNEAVELYITGVGVPLLTFAGFLAVYLGFLSQERQNAQQEEHFQKNRFESTFFQLLRTHNQIVEDVRVEKKESTDVKHTPPGVGDYETVVVSGRSCFEKFDDQFEKLLDETAQEKDWEDSDIAEIEKMRHVYGKWLNARESQLTHYFHHLTKLICFVHESRIKDKEFYIDLVIAQMSAAELRLFFYHHSIMENERGHRYLREVTVALEENTFFEKLDSGYLIHHQHHYFNREAFGTT